MAKLAIKGGRGRFAPNHFLAGLNLAKEGKKVLTLVLQGRNWDGYPSPTRMLRFSTNALPPFRASVTALPVPMLFQQILLAGPCVLRVFAVNFGLSFAKCAKGLAKVLWVAAPLRRGNSVCQMRGVLHAR